MKSTYQEIKKQQLRSSSDQFSFSKQMQLSVRSNLWRNKEALWTILSGACDDAAKECYIKINNMVSQIADVDTCNIHSLKSLANSVDAGFLTQNLREDYDTDILQLINLFSVPKEYILNSNVFLHQSVNQKYFGYLTLKSLNLQSDEVPIDLIYNIKANAQNIEHVFERNIIPPSRLLKDLLKEDLDDLKIANLENSETLISFLNSLDSESSAQLNVTAATLIKTLTLSDILEQISKFKENEDLSIYKSQKLLVSSKDNQNDLKINYFYLLINIIRQNYFNVDEQVYLIPSYYNKELNKDVDISKLIFNIIGLIHLNTKTYLNEFVGYHFFFTILSKIINNDLKTDYIFDKKLNTYIFNQSKTTQMTKDQFIAELTSYISYEDAINFVQKNSISKYRKQFIDFIKYLTKLNKALKLVSNDTKSIDYDIIQLNFGNKFENVLYSDEGIVFHLTKQYIDECINIRNIRQNLKKLIQQYTFIGTKKIATNLLYDFFTQNYSNRDSAGYLSSDDIISGNNQEYDFGKIKRTISDLIFGSKISDGTFLDNKFQVNIIQYYDTTTYLNIQAEMPSTLIQNQIVDYQEVLSTYVDQDYLITSSYVKKPIYSNQYAPCSLFIKDYNKKFWKNSNILINSESNTILSDDEDYINFYSNYVPQLKITSVDAFKSSYLNETLKPLLYNIWDTFALSSVTESDLTTDIGVLYKEYIGNGLGKNKFANHANSTFPTIAPIQNIQNLVQCSSYDNQNLLFLAKNYYFNVIEKIKVATKKMLAMYNEDGVPSQNWRQSYINFHGYATVYESSNNKLQYSIKTSKKYKNNGPFVYCKLQELYYKYHLSGTINIDQFLKQYDCSQTISKIYDQYLNGKLNDIFFNEDEKISNYHIKQYDEDIYQNCFTLFKKQNQLAGRLFFRSYNMPISLPLVDLDLSVLSISNNNVLKIVNDIANNCIQFGLLNKYMWMFGKCQGNYRLVFFKYQMKNEIPDLIQSSYKSLTADQNVEFIKCLNDYVGTFYQDQIIHFVLFDCYSILKDLSSQYQTSEDELALLFKNSFSFNLFSIDTKTDEMTKKYLKNYNNADMNAPLPMFLKHDQNSITMNNDQRIWNIILKDNVCYISYKALNQNVQDSTFDYYFNYNTNNYYIETMNCNWNGYLSRLGYINIQENTIQNQMIFQLNQEKYTIILSNQFDKNQNIQIFKNQLNNINSCFIKNTRIYSKFNPFNIGYQFTDNFIQLLINQFIENQQNQITFEKVYNMISSNDTIINFINNKKWTKNTILTYQNLKSSYQKILNIISNMTSNIFKIQKKYSDGVLSSSIFNQSNQYFKLIPVIKTCCIQPMKIDIVFQNDSGVTFFNQNSFDLDVTCYINDEIQKYRKVGYGNEYQRTAYLYWEGDERNGGNETLKIDVNKYIENKLQNLTTNTNMQIVFNVCWHEASQITTQNVYALVYWNNLVQKYPIKITGTNQLSCNTKSFSININMLTNELTFDTAKIYPIIKVNYQEELLGYESQPSIQLGTYILTENDFEKITQNNWTKYNDSLYYYKDENSIYYLLNSSDYIIQKNSNYDVLNLYKRMISDLFYIKNGKSVINAQEIILNQVFFGTEYDINNIGVDMNYVIYVKPKYFSKAKNTKYKINYLLHDLLKEASYQLTEKE